MCIFAKVCWGFGFTINLKFFIVGIFIVMEFETGLFFDCNYFMNVHKDFKI